MYEEQETSVKTATQQKQEQVNLYIPVRDSASMHTELEHLLSSHNVL